MGRSVKSENDPVGPVGRPLVSSTMIQPEPATKIGVPSVFLEREKLCQSEGESVLCWQIYLSITEMCEPCLS